MSKSRPNSDINFSKVRYIVNTYAKPYFSCFLDERYTLSIIPKIEGANISIHILINFKSKSPDWCNYNGKKCNPELLGSINIKNMSGYISMMKVGYWVPDEIPDDIHRETSDHFNNKGIGQYLMLLFFYICCWCNIKEIELDDMSNNPHFYKKLGFNYIEKDSPPEMIVDLYKDDAFKYIYTILNKIISKTTNEKWKWNKKCLKLIPPNPSTIVQESGKGRIKKKQKKSKLKKRRKTKNKTKGK